MIACVLLQHCFFLRDQLETMGNRKIREVTDFDWRRNTRVYYQEVEGKPRPLSFTLGAASPKSVDNFQLTDKCLCIFDLFQDLY